MTNRVGFEALELTQCPNCDYSLTGLPEEGVCPECGSRYDQQFVILQGDRYGVISQVTPPLLVAGLTAYLVPSIHRQTLFPFFVGLFLASTVLPVLIQWLSQRSWRDCIVFGEVGIGYFPGGYGSPVEVIVSQLLYMAFFTLCMIMLNGPFITFFVAAMFLWQSASQLRHLFGRKPAAGPGGTPMRVYPWSAVQTITVEVAGSRMHSINVTKPGWFDREWGVINTTVNLSRRGASDLRTLINRWRQGSQALPLGSTGGGD